MYSDQIFKLDLTLFTRKKGYASDAEHLVYTPEYLYLQQIDLPTITSAFTKEIGRVFSSNNCDPEQVVILYNNQVEWLNEHDIVKFNAVVKSMHDIFSIPYENFVMITVGTPCKINNDIFDRYNIWQKPRILYNPLMLEMCVKNNRQFDLNLLPKTKKKKFLFYNNSCRAHRVAMVEDLHHKGILEDSIWSTGWSQHDPRVQFSKDIFPDLFHDEEIEMPKILDYNSQDTITLNPEHYSETYCSIVSETVFLTHNHGFDPGFDNPDLPGSIFFTEKLYKPIMARHPFILISTPYSLKTLKELGFKTFDFVFEENYDSIMDDQQRLKTISGEIERLNKLTDAEWLEILERLQPILNHNRNHAIEILDNIQ